MVKNPMNSSALLVGTVKKSHSTTLLESALDDESTEKLIQKKAEQLWTDTVGKSVVTGTQQAYQMASKIIKMRELNGFDHIGKYDCALVTINPDPYICEDPSVLLDKWYDLIESKLFELDLDATMSIEQRLTLEETEQLGEWSGFHMHIVLERKRKTSNSNPAKIRQLFEKTFGDIIFDPQHINIKYGSDKKNFLAYISGDKKDDIKKSKCENDRKMREFYQLENLYFSSSSSSSSTEKFQTKEISYDDIDVIS